MLVVVSCLLLTVGIVLSVGCSVLLLMHVVVVCCSVYCVVVA